MQSAALFQAHLPGDFHAGNATLVFGVLLKN
jgi:hypothetical protein